LADFTLSAKKCFNCGINCQVRLVLWRERLVSNLPQETT